MDYMDKLFKEKIAVIYEAIDEKERALEKSFQDERRKAEFYTDPLENIEDRKHRYEFLPSNRSLVFAIMKDM